MTTLAFDDGPLAGRRVAVERELSIGRTHADLIDAIAADQVGVISE